ncbi:MAG: nicotinate phosphoribosyltransferase [Candidatus Fraserbacteria bacterium RBG_16_55_9]|uniref:nicotinate phosphoribosyltransferase n=1 Tax=Fraserbacteria sp. (strain RBG_16_55_9) TaxID=1817864 RepID=A0A1F5UUH4_FRAXR|nr:MAG: nicotinate phosphoribosyltransferase [Candidatus Fraserbacteria bacterium RBG_16_55_9]
MKRRSKERAFHFTTAAEIRAGQVTDVYFERTRQILTAKKIDKHVIMEARVKKLPQGDWGLFCGVHEAIELFQGMPLDLWALPEGSLFQAREPVLLVGCRYREFSVYETALLGFLCQASGIATKAARCVIAAQGRPIYSFGARRMHPAIAPMIERAAFIGGCAGVASVVAARLLGEEPVGTIPHALILVMGDSVSATLAFDEVIDKSVKRVALVDTFGDEKFEALENAELLDSNIYAVRLDTPSSRRGDMLEIAREVRWELDIHGYENVKIFISGGLDEDLIPPLNEVADAYGMGTSISNARVIDFGLDIVEVEGDPVAKRGKESGAKQLYACKVCGKRTIALFTRPLKACPACRGKVEPKLVQFLKQGRLIRELPRPQEIRKRVLSQLPKEL